MGDFFLDRLNPILQLFDKTILLLININAFNEIISAIRLKY